MCAEKTFFFAHIFVFPAPKVYLPAFQNFPPAPILFDRELRFSVRGVGKVCFAVRNEKCEHRKSIFWAQGGKFLCLCYEVLWHKHITFCPFTVERSLIHFSKNLLQKAQLSLFLFVTLNFQNREYTRQPFDGCGEKEQTYLHRSARQGQESNHAYCDRYTAVGISAPAVRPPKVVVGGRFCAFVGGVLLPLGRFPHASGTR